MALLTEALVLERAQRMGADRRWSTTAASNNAIGPEDAFDVFLSHSSNEPDNILLGVTGLLEDEELTVYVDRYSDPELSTDRVTAKTAELLAGVCGRYPACFMYTVCIRKPPGGCLGSWAFSMAWPGPSL